MKQRQKFSIFKRIFNFFHSFFNHIHPRYQLALDHSEYDINSKRNIHCFKSFGDHSFVKLTFDQIKHGNDLLFAINPHDLIKICLEEILLEQKSNQFRISEILRDNNFILSDKKNSQIFSGEEICDNVLLIEKINNIDLYKIAYNTGFNQGRKVSKIVNKKQKEKYSLNNVIKLMP